MVKIVVIGASGYIGKPTLSHLLKLVDPATVYIATRNPDAEVNAPYKAAGAHVIHGDLGNYAATVSAFAGADTVYIIAPGTEVSVAVEWCGMWCRGIEGLAGERGAPLCGGLRVMLALALCARLTCFGLVVWCAPWLAVLVASPQNRASLVVSGVNAAKEAGVKHLVVLSVSTADIVSVLFGRQFHEIETAVKASGLAWTLVRLPIFTDNLWYVLVWGREGMEGAYGRVRRSMWACVQ